MRRALTEVLCKDQPRIEPEPQGRDSFEIRTEPHIILGDWLQHLMFRFSHFLYLYFSLNFPFTGFVEVISLGKIFLSILADPASEDPHLVVGLDLLALGCQQHLIQILDGLFSDSSCVHCVKGSVVVMDFWRFGEDCLIVSQS